MSNKRKLLNVSSSNDEFPKLDSSSMMSCEKINNKKTKKEEMTRIEKKWFDEINKCLNLVVPISELIQVISNYSFENFTIILSSITNEIEELNKRMDILEEKKNKLYAFENSFDILNQPWNACRGYYDFAIKYFQNNFTPNEYSIGVEDGRNRRDGTLKIELNNCLLKVKVSHAFGKQYIEIITFVYKSNEYIKKQKISSDIIPATIFSIFFRSTQLDISFNDPLLKVAFQSLYISRIWYESTPKVEEATQHFQDFVTRFPDQADFALVMCVFASLLN